MIHTPTSISLNPDAAAVGMNLAAASLHTAVLADNFQPAAVAYAGELAGVRIARLCDEESVFVDVAAGDTSAMGPQPVGALPDLLRECELADEGVLLERLDGRLGYDPRESRYNIAVSMALQFDPQVTNLVPVDDDRTLYNRVTVSRQGGSSATVERTDGPLSVDPLTGVGPRPLPLERNLATDSALADHASYIVYRGTVDRPRYQLVLDLIANPDLIDDWLACDIGSRITVDGAPAKHVGPDTLDLILEGYTETFDSVTWLVAMWLEPYAPYDVRVLSADGNTDGDGWDDWDTCVLAEDLDATETGVDVTTTPLLSTAAGDMGYRIRIGGEVMTVTNVTGSSNPQTMTVTRSVNGVVKTHDNGDPVILVDALILTL